MAAILDLPEVPIQPAIGSSDSGARPAAILDLAEVRARVSPLSVKAYEALTEKGFLEKSAELIRGIIVKKMPKSPLHRRLTKSIYDYCHARQPSAHVTFQEAPLQLADSMPEPNVMMVRGQERDYDAKHPTTAELVVAVAVSSVELDRENASLYAEAGVSEYWIVLGGERQVEVYRQPENGVYQHRRVYAMDETLASAGVLGLQVVLADWFA